MSLGVVTHPAKLLSGAALARGRSKQDYGTPFEFIEAVETRFGSIDFDLAAHDDNCVTGKYFGPEQNSLVQDWLRLDGTLWLNPPFYDIAPWASKCASVRHRRAWTLLLVPASVGSNWYANHVEGKAFEMPLRPRLSFDRKNPYPKDLALFAFGFGVSGSETWKWK